MQKLFSNSYVKMSKPSFLNFRYSLSKKPKPSPSPSPQTSFNQKQVIMQPKAEEIRWVFDKFDKNKDGKISKEEYKAALSLLGKGVAASDVDKSFEFVDTDGDGFISFSEFVEMMKSYNKGDGVKKSDIRSAFKMFDKNGDGKISADELLQVLKNLGEKCSLDSCRKMIRGVDADGDGLIDIDEFTHMMTRTMKVA